MNERSPLEEHHERQPILHSPYDEPDRHWALVDHQTTGRINPYRRPAHLAAPSRLPRDGQLRLGERIGKGWTPPSMVDELREEVRAWRNQGWAGATQNTRRLLEYWARPPGEGAVHSPFYAQREAVETIVYLTEAVAGNDPWVKYLKLLGKDWSRGLVRLAIRMATGTGKTTVMALLIAWYAVNRRAEHRHIARGLARNVGRIVVIAPGRTISRQLRRRLDPRHAENLYDSGRLLPVDLQPRINSVRVNVLNFEKLQPRTGAGLKMLETKGSRTQAIAWAQAGGAAEVPETYDQMWDRLLGRPDRRHGDRIVVFNDEAHHCWERKAGHKGGRDKGVWMEAIHQLDNHPRYRVAQTIDLSATPIFIDPPKTHTPDGQRIDPRQPLVPWIVSEFALTESMEAGLVTIPMPPRKTDADAPGALQNLYEDNNGRVLDTIENRRRVLNAARLLYNDYEKTFREWQKLGQTDPSIGHPVLIVIANSKKNAQALLAMLGGRKRDATKVYDPPSDFALLSNVPHAGATKEECMARPARTILVHSGGNTAAEKKEGSRFDRGAIGVEEVKNNLRQRRRIEEILESVAEPGRPGQDVRCVVSVGMLTEGWDCQRVTHILGYRKFGSRLLCEQTMGRALRRHDYENRIEARRQDNGQITERFEANYATVLGVPFDQYGIKGRPSGNAGVVKPRTEVHVVDDRRISHRIRVPDFQDYALVHTTPSVRLDPQRVAAATLLRRGPNVEITWAQCRGPFGKTHVIKAVPLGRPETGIWRLSADLTTKLAGDSGKDALQRSSRLFASCLGAVREWLGHDNVHCERTEVLLDDETRQEALHQILHAILDDEDEPIQKVGRPRKLSQPCRAAGSWRPFSTTLTNVVQIENSELNVAACHNRFETHIARALDGHGRVAAFFRNHGPERFEIPYKSGGQWGRFVPDFIVRAETVELPQPAATPRVVPHLIVEGKGPLDAKARDKATWTKEWWVPAANHAASVEGEREVRWTYLELRPSDDLDVQIDNAIERAAQTP